MKIFFRMKKFIVIQMQINSDNTIGSERNVLMSNVVRQIDAESQEIAIGKFVLATQDIKAVKKMDIECYELSSLKSID